MKKEYSASNEHYDKLKINASKVPSKLNIYSDIHLLKMKNILILIHFLISSAVLAQKGIDGYYTSGPGRTGFGVQLDDDFSFRIDMRICLGSYVDTGFYELVQDTILFHSAADRLDSLSLKRIADRHYRVDNTMADSVFSKMLYSDDKIYFIYNNEGQQWISQATLIHE